MASEANTRVFEAQVRALGLVARHILSDWARPHLGSLFCAPHLQMGTARRPRCGVRAAVSARPSQPAVKLLCGPRGPSGRSGIQRPRLAAEAAGHPARASNALARMPGVQCRARPRRSGQRRRTALTSQPQADLAETPAPPLHARASETPWTRQIGRTSTRRQTHAPRQCHSNRF